MEERKIIFSQYCDRDTVRQMRRGYGPPMKRARLTLGNLYIVQKAFGGSFLVKFIKATPKGFNFLDIGTSKCILKNHMYDKSLSGKPVPRDWTSFLVGVPPWVTQIRTVAESEEA